jgi:hypothetical protein
MSNYGCTKYNVYMLAALRVEDNVLAEVAARRLLNMLHKKLALHLLQMP